MANERSSGENSGWNMGQIGGGASGVGVAAGSFFVLVLGAMLLYVMYPVEMYRGFKGDEIIELFPNHKCCLHAIRPVVRRLVIVCFHRAKRRRSSLCFMNDNRYKIL